MVGKILDGKKISNEKKQKLTNEIIARNKDGIPPPCLAVILIGDNPASKVYVKNKKESCTEVGIKSLSYDLNKDTSTKELIKLINELNNNKKVNGILVQLPLPKHIDANLILETISPKKDVDGFHPFNIGRLAQNNPLIRPCTPYGIVQLLEINNINFKGLDAVVIGESNIVGRPMALELLKKEATVTICHIHTKNLKKYVSNAELLIVATGNPHLIKGDWIKQNAIVIDVGINRLEDGKIVGDVEFDEAIKKASYITPVPGGVGPMTISMLLHNTLLAQKIQRNEEIKK